MNKITYDFFYVLYKKQCLAKSDEMSDESFIQESLHRQPVLLDKSDENFVLHCFTPYKVPHECISIKIMHILEVTLFQQDLCKISFYLIKLSVRKFAFFTSKFSLKSDDLMKWKGFQIIYLYLCAKRSTNNDVVNFLLKEHGGQNSLEMI